ncbi:MAG: carbon-nitrogen hydrolase family protein [Myxococcota bacterium]
MARITLVELPARFGDASGQLARLDAVLGAAPPGGLALLGELALTGYVSEDGDFDASGFAEPLDGPTAQALAERARRHGCALVGPLVEGAAAKAFNAVVGFAPDGTRWLHYRKRHPWMPETWAAPGDLPMPLVEWRGLTVTAAICFDAQFLAEEAGEVLSRADLLLFPSAWVEEVDSRPELLGGLARRFDVAIVNANWGPGRPRVPGQGRSMAVSRSGEVVAETRPGQERLDVALSALGLE